MKINMRAACFYFSRQQSGDFFIGGKEVVQKEPIGKNVTI